MTTNSSLSDNTMKQSETNQKTILNNINQLQQMESDLYNQLEKSTAEGADDSEQETIINKINEISTMRMTMFSDLDLTLKTTEKQVVQSRNDLVNQLTTTQIMEKDLNNSKANLANLKTSKANKMRMVEINTYYASKYKAQINVMKTIIMMCIPLSVLAIISKKNLIPDYISKSLMGVVIVIGTIVIIKQIYDLTSRNNMNFDEYNWKWDPANDNPSVYEYDKAQFTSSADKTSATPTPEFSLSGCVGEECCSSGTYYSSVQKQCLTGSKETNNIEGFSKGRSSNTFVEPTGSICPFKQINTIVKPFNETQTNYVNVSTF